MAKPTITERDRFWSKVRKTDGCWEWTGTVTATGYGRFQVGYGRPGPGGSRVEWVHRYSYATFVGPLLPGLQIDHLCRNRRCVRPDHLEQVTLQENLRRGQGNQYRGQSVCHRGHVYTPETIRWVGPDRQWRQCRTCERERWAGHDTDVPKPGNSTAA